jgi:Kdo2-lipid IVA lauroyltransferase/acyltransferase
LLPGCCYFCGRCLLDAGGWVPSALLSLLSFCRREGKPAAGFPQVTIRVMRKRSPIRDGLEYCLAAAALKSLEYAPLAAARRLGLLYARLLDRALPRLRKVADRNLSFAMPHLTGEERHRTIDGVFRSIGRLLVAFARFPSINRENLGDWLRLEGGEHFDAALRQGRGVLFATAHLGNWELSAFAHSLLRGPMNVVARPLDNRWIDGLVERRRALSGNSVLLKHDSARAIFKALAANQAVGILIDQNASPDNGVFVNFFGTAACAGAGFAKIAYRSGAVAIPGFALWDDKEGRYVLRFYPPVPMTGDIARDTEALQRHLESVIRAHPEQWLWIHRRWKTRPAGEPSLYF